MWQDKSETDILLQTPFLARTVMSLPLVEDSNIPTMATDGFKILYNPQWTSALSLPEVTAVRVHECLHILLGHHVRRGSRESERWNAACDYELNPYVLEAGYILPLGALLNSAYTNMSAEQIYDLLPPSTKAPKYGSVIDASQDSIELSNIAKEWRIQAQADRWSSLPESLDRALKERLEPKGDLANRLIPWLTQIIGEDETWSPPSRRHPLMPGCDYKTDGYVVLCVDTSGSITESQIKTMAQIALSVPLIARLDVIFADAAINKIIEDISDQHSLIFAFQKAIGGGGTDFRPAIMEAERRSPDAIIYMTDGAGSFPEKIPVCPILWSLLDHKAKVPFGDSLLIT